MKKKYLKKMLAIMLASMTVAATPGLVGAMKEESKNTIQTINSQIAKHKLTTNEATAFLDKLEKIANEDDDAKKEVAKTLGDMINEGLFDRAECYPPDDFEQQTPPPEYLSKIINILKTCSSCVDARKDVAEAVENMVSENLLGRIASSYDGIYISPCSSEQISDVMDILEKCLKDNERMVAVVIDLLAFKGLLEQYPDKNKILNILQECLNSSEPYFRENVADAVCELVDQNVFERNSAKPILDILKQCLSTDGANSSIAKSIMNMAEKDMLGKDSTDQTMDILNSCSADSNSGTILGAIRAMIKKDLINEQNIGEPLIQILQKLSGSDPYLDYAALIIKLLAQNNLLNNCSVDKLKPIINLLLSCRADVYFDMINVLESIRIMSEKNILNKLDTADIQRIVDKLINDAKWYDCRAIQAIKAMNDKNLLNECEPKHIRQLFKALIGHLQDEFKSEDMGADAALTILEMDGKGVLKKCEPDDLADMVSSLIDNLDNNNAREISVKIIAAIIQNHNVLKQLNDAQIQKLINSLPGALANNSTQESATTILAAMAENDMLNKFNNAQIQQILGLLKEQLRNYLTAGNYEMVDKIFSFLDFCSKDNNLREYTSDIIGMLSGNVNFYSYLNENAQIPRLENVLETLILCTQAQNGRTREAALGVIDSVFTNTGIPQIPGIPHAINKTIGATDQTIAQINNKIPQIIEMLQRLSTVRGSKKAVAFIIDSLGKRGFFRELPKEGQDGLIATLRNFLICNGRQIASDDFNLSDLEMEDLNHAEALPAVCNLVKDNTWTAPLFADNLLSENKKEFEKVFADISTVGQKLGATETNE